MTNPAAALAPAAVGRLVSGTSLAAVLSTALVSAYTYSSSGCVDLAAASLVSPAAMLTAPLGARLTTRLDCAALRRILGYFLLAAAPLVPLKVRPAACVSCSFTAGRRKGLRCQLRPGSLQLPHAAACCPAESPDLPCLPAGVSPGFSAG
jgi:hypothetical protein